MERKDASHDLIARAKSGDQVAFAEIYKIHVGRVFGLCLRILGDRSRAEELTQRVFVRTWNKLDSYRFESSFSSWLYRLAMNVLLNELKTKISMRSWDCSFEDLPIDMNSQGRSSPELKIDLERAIAALPAGARVIFVLHEIEGFDHNEIAERLGLANGTCKAQLSRARRLLREALKNHEMRSL